METGGDQVVNPTNNLKRTRSNFDRLSWSRAKQGNAETGEEREYISLMSAFMMLTTWSTSSSNVLFPWCYGVLGLAGGPIFMLLSFFVNWTATRWTVDAAVATGSETFGDLGEALIGWKGRFIFEGSQILFQQLFLPVAIVLCVGAVQSLTIDVGWTDCNGNVAIIFTAIGLVLIQVSRELENVTGLAYVSAVLNCIMTACIAYEVTTSPSPAAGPDGELPEGANWEWFVYQGDHPERYHWTAVLGAFGIFVYACLPSCIVVETTAALHPKDRPKMWMAVNGSFFMYISIYFVAGIPSVYYWGGDIPEPIEFGNSPAGILIKCVLMYGTGLDFILASITVNRWAVSYINPDFDYEWTKANTIKWFFYSIPSSAIAVLMALFVPRFESLTGILNSVAGATLQVTATPLCLYLSTNSAVKAMQDEKGGMALLVGGMGIVFTAGVFTSAVYNIVTTSYTPGPGETYWCDLAG